MQSVLNMSGTWRSLSCRRNEGHNRTYFVCLMVSFLVVTVSVGADQNRWWPVQAMPKGLVRVQENGFPEPHAACAMMAQSVAGLAAKDVNEGPGDEMVWVGTENIDIEDWYARLLKRQPQLEQRGTFPLWKLIDRYVTNGIIKGYILYRWDGSKGDFNEHRPGMDCSVNVATSLAGLLDGVIIEESLEGEAKQHGLKLLMDVREKTQTWCFETYRDQFNRHLLCTQDPHKPNARDVAIAQKCFTTYGDDKSVAVAMKWLEPLSPILGWNGGDEFKTTRMSTVYGHMQTSTDWVMNLPVLMAGTEKGTFTKPGAFDPRTIDWKDRRSAVCFIDTDGDNVDFVEGSFFRGNEGKSYWGNSERGKIPFGWSCCFAHLAQLCPEAIEYAAATQTTNDWFVEFGGGYYYPDLFGMDRTNRWELLAKHVQKTWAWMKQNNTHIIGFNVTRLDSPDALKAYEVIAGQMDGLLAILVFQYYPYEGGGGKTFWVKDRNGVEVPVISARYSLWEHSNQRARAGTPAKIAREIRQTVQQSQPAELPRYDWAIAHAWSWFKNAPGSDEDAENMTQEDAAAHGGQRGFAPVLWCAGRLPTEVRVIGPEELAWRVRMRHNPNQTRKLIQE